jgi:molecular chaperone DnaK
VYALGIDLGTVFTAAATWRDGHAEIATLGSRAASIPSVVLLRDDDSFLTGEAANRRALLQPGRVAREFKRRFGDSTPILLGGTPYSAESLMAKLLGTVVADVTAREGEPPSAVCLCHPANWGPYKTDLLRQAVRMADLRAPVTMAIEPAAAAAYYARQTRIEPGSVVAVYDLGGGTFDAAVLRKTSTGFEIMGRPEGIEHLGGADFDAAVFHHVRSVVGSQLDALDDSAPTTVAAVARLREECTEAKEMLSSDTDTSIPVLLPNFATEVRLTREELERMLRPALYDTIEALQRAIRSAGVEPEQLHSVLLIGGSSRMPLVAQLVGAELGRPVAVDAHPKHAVALGAAWVAGEQMTGAPLPAPAEPLPSPATVANPVVTAGAGAGSNGNGSAADSPARGATEVGALTTVGAAAPASHAGAGAAPAPPSSAPTVSALPSSAPPSSAPIPGPDALQPGPMPPGWGAPPPPASSAAAAMSAMPPSGPPTDPSGAWANGIHPLAGGPAPQPWRFAGLAQRWVMIAAALTTAAVVVVVGAYFAGSSGLFSGNGKSSDASVAGASGSSQSSAGGAGTASTAAKPAAATIYDCPTSATVARWGCLTQAKVSGGKITIAYTTNFPLSAVQDANHFHFHLFLANPGPTGGTVPADAFMQHVPNFGSWFIIYDKAVTVIDANTEQGGTKLGLQTSQYKLLCVRVASGLHGLVPDKAGGLRSGNCVKLT